jgi:foldase protein PrsA
MDPTVGSAGRDNLAATVNGEPITRDELFELMVADCGLDAAEQLIATAVVEQAAAEMNIAVTSEDVDAENRRTIERIAPDVSEADRQRVLAELLARRGISPQRWRMTMRRNAILAEIAARRITITDPMIRAEYNRTYGPKVEVRHIQSDSARQAMNVLDLYEAGADFGDLARQWSTNAQTAPRGGLIPPFSSDTEEAPAQIRQVAFELEEGQVSGVIQHLEDYHVIKLERTIPAQDVEYETVRDELRQRLRRRRIAAAQSDILLSLIRDADVRFHHPVLREQHQARTPMDAPREQ